MRPKGGRLAATRARGLACPELRQLGACPPKADLHQGNIRSICRTDVAAVKSWRRASLSDALWPPVRQA